MARYVAAARRPVKSMDLVGLPGSAAEREHPRGLVTRDELALLPGPDACEHARHELVLLAVRDAGARAFAARCRPPPARPRRGRARGSRSALGGRSITWRPNDSTPRPCRTSLIAPPNAVSNSSSRLTVTSAIVPPVRELAVGEPYRRERMDRRRHTIALRLQWPSPRGRSSDWLERRPVTAEAAGSSPVAPARCILCTRIPE